MRNIDGKNTRDKNLTVVDVNALLPEARAEVEAEIERHRVEKERCRKVKQTFREVKKIRNEGLPKWSGDPVTGDGGGNFASHSPMPRGQNTVEPSVVDQGIAPAGAGHYAPARRDPALVKGKEPPKRPDGRGSVVAEPGARSRPMGFSSGGVDIVAVDEDGREIRQPGR